MARGSGSKQTPRANRRRRWRPANRTRRCQGKQVAWCCGDDVWQHRQSPMECRLEYSAESRQRSTGRCRQQQDAPAFAQRRRRWTAGQSFAGRRIRTMPVHERRSSSVAAITGNDEDAAERDHDAVTPENIAAVEVRSLTCFEHKACFCTNGLENSNIVDGLCGRDASGSTETASTFIDAAHRHDQTHRHRKDSGAPAAMGGSCRSSTEILRRSDLDDPRHRPGELNAFDLGGHACRVSTKCRTRFLAGSRSTDQSSTGDGVNIPERSSCILRDSGEERHVAALRKYCSARGEEL